MIFWIIGLSGSGKSTLANMLYQEINPNAKNTIVLDGDSFREAMINDLGHTLEDRRINGQRILNFSLLLDNQGINVITPILSIFPEHQLHLRQHAQHYCQIYIKATLNTVANRDSKKIYEKTTNIVGRDLEFPEPLESDYIFDNTYKHGPADRLVKRIYQENKEKLHI